MRRRRKPRRGIFIPTGQAPRGVGRGTAHSYADQLRESGLVRDVDVPAYLRRVRRAEHRRSFGVGAFFDRLRARGVPIYDETAAKADQDGYRWGGDS